MLWLATGYDIRMSLGSASANIHQMGATPAPVKTAVFNASHELTRVQIRALTGVYSRIHPIKDLGMSSLHPTQF